MATAIPPNAAEVAISRPERQKFRRSGGECLSCEGSASEGETSSKRNLRSGIKDLERKDVRKESAEKLIFEKCVYVGEG
jgi:hypothetical protein